LRATSGGKAQLSVFPGGVAPLPGETARLVLAPLESRSSSEAWEFVSANRALKVKELAAAIKAAPDGVFSPLSLFLTNSTERNLPPGEIACYLDGEYSGSGRFPGLEAAKSLYLECMSR
jgi:hypothetical protein